MEYGKIISGAESVKCNTFEFPRYVSIVFADEQPTGYLPVEKVLPKPEVPAGKWLAFNYTDTGTALRKEYFLVDEGKSAYERKRVYVTADLIEALMDEGVWESAKAWIVDNDILDLVLATKEFDENNQNFQAGKSALQAQLGWSDEEVEEFLDRCAKD